MALSGAGSFILSWRLLRSCRSCVARFTSGGNGKIFASCHALWLNGAPHKLEVDSKEHC